jgi:radical SAM protein with 4Fe4S-binding SPASM domain
MGAPDYVNPMAKEPLMDMGIYRRLMSEAERMDLPAMTFGYLSEPLLRRDLPGMIRLAREAGVMDIRLGTNGLLLSPQIGRDLIEAGLTRLEVSVDAARPDTYRRIRRGGRLELVEKNILDFIEARAKSSAGFPVLRLSFLRLPHNESELEDFLAFWRDKADLFSIQEPIFFEDAPICRELDLTEASAVNEYRCAQPWQRVVIRSNGDVFPCCSLYGLAMNVGSVKETDVTEIWNRPAMDSLRALHREGRFKDNRACRRCAARSNVKIETRPDPAGRNED